MKNLETIEEPEWDFYNYAIDLEKEWRMSLPRFTDKELLAIFPEARTIIPQKMAEWEEKRIEFSGRIRKNLALIKDQVSDEFSQWFWREWVKMNDGMGFLRIERHIERLKRLLWVARGKKSKGQLTEDQIQQARAVPIENLISQPLRKSGKTLVGLCPLHNENHPSFHVYLANNSFYCYGCNQGGDTIQFVRLLHGYSFKEAVRYLF